MTFQIDAKNEFINKIFENKEKYENLIKEMVKSTEDDEISIRRSDNKLFLDLKIKVKLDKRTEIIFNFYYDVLLFLNRPQIFFQNVFTFEKLKEMNFEEFLKLFFSFQFLLTGRFKNCESLLQTLKQLTKEVIEEDIIIKIFIIMIKLFNSSNAKFILDIQFDKIFKLLIEDKKENLKAYYNNFKEKIEGVFANFFAPFLEKSFSCKMSEDLVYDNILFTIFFGKFKYGVGVEIKSKGINDCLKELIN